jgi:hypothetical protein
MDGMASIGLPPFARARWASHDNGAPPRGPKGRPLPRKSREAANPGSIAAFEITEGQFDSEAWSFLPGIIKYFPATPEGGRSLRFIETHEVDSRYIFRSIPVPANA